MSRMVVEIAPWRAEWSGGRLADVFHAENPSPLTCFEVDGWDWATSSASGDRADLERGLREWIAEDGAVYLREMPYL